jgi:hypothetical protein
MFRDDLDNRLARWQSVTGESVVERYCGHKAAAGSLAERRVLAATGEKNWLTKLLWKARDGYTIMPSWKSKKEIPADNVRKFSVLARTSPPSPAGRR